MSPATTNAITPIVYGDTIIVSTQDAGVSAFKPIKRNGQWTVQTIWQADKVALKLSTPVLVGDTLYGLSHKNGGQLFALDAKTGIVLWLGKTRDATRNAGTAIVKSGDLLFLLNEDAELTVAKSSRTGFEPLHKYVVAETATWAQPTISGNRIFVKDVSTLALWTLN